MIEFTFISENNKLGFQPQNIGNVRISGAELSIFGQAKIGSVPINILGGYTFISPVYKNYDESEQIRNSISEAKNVLKYRSKHLSKMDLEANFAPIIPKRWIPKMKHLKLAGSAQYASHVINVDKAFEAIPQLGNLDFFGVGQYRDVNNKGYLLIDTRMSLALKRATWTFLINNVLNREYSLRPALLEAPISYALRLDFDF
jgi:outer membrane receptor protein involved in Fe transport